MWRGDQKDAIFGYRQKRTSKTAESWWAKPGLSWDGFSAEVKRLFPAR